MAELTKGTVLVAHPCEVVVTGRAGNLAWSWCRTCFAAHLIDAAGFEAGNGPWRLAEPCGETDRALPAMGVVPWWLR